MERKLKDHIRYLEEQVEVLSGRLMDSSVNQEERNRLESDIRAANLALSYYRQALDLEKSLTQPVPSGQ